MAGAITNLSRILALFCAVSGCTAVCETVSEERVRGELRQAIGDRAGAAYLDFCRGLGSGRIFDVRNEEIQLRGNLAAVSYVLVVFESCEEGAAYQAVRKTETWIRRAKGWERLEFYPGP